MTVYSTTICGLFLQIVLNSKRNEIRKTLHQLCKLSKVLNPQGIIGSNCTYRNLTVYLSAVIGLFALLIVFFFYQEWDNYKNTVAIHLSMVPELRDVCLAFIYMSIIFSIVSGGSVCGVTSLLCDSAFLTLGNFIKSYRLDLINKMKTQDLRRNFFAMR
ncbi:hypothetical protein AVEN_138915-1 [Araneus ventricosus]|uniref:Uncharacterized protein n=1 Tax=Araneus ventricosus TaxID=182803 RepID=A0A4Y2TLK1_ARAVE|nr:hypothetical protein AVEN_138915-1 [Araneus ventricosus]